jgi:hypothetical protein
MNNLKIQNYQPAPVASTIQKGGRGYRHKRSCKCRLCKCKKRGGMEPEKDEYKDISLDLMEKNLGEREIFDENVDSLELGNTQNVNDALNGNEDSVAIDVADEDGDLVIDVADDNEYNDLEEEEQGTGSSGGTRRRKYGKKSKKVRKSKKTRRNSRKSRKHGRKSHRRHRN